MSMNASAAHAPGKRRRIPTTDPRVAVAYLRVSTENQHLGPEAQRASIEAWAKRGGVTVAHWSTDHVSGAAEAVDRPGLTEALEAVAKHGAGVLVVAKRDRLARDVVIAAMVERVARGRGAQIVSADGVGNGDQPADAFMRSIIDAAAAYERELIRARTRAALQALRRQGKRAGTVPWGFTLGSEGDLVENPDEVAVTVRAREIRDEGVTLRGVVEQLNVEGRKTRTGGSVTLTQVARLLRLTQPTAPTE
jgi:DNA invertase Pin-like site-specific DNA recombinase